MKNMEILDDFGRFELFWALSRAEDRSNVDWARGSWFWLPGSDGHPARKPAQMSWTGEHPT